MSLVIQHCLSYAGYYEAVCRLLLDCDANLEGVTSVFNLELTLVRQNFKNLYYSKHFFNSEFENILLDVAIQSAKLVINGIKQTKVDVVELVKLKPVRDDLLIKIQLCWAVQIAVLTTKLFEAKLIITEQYVT